MQRIKSVDAFRGLCIFYMLLGHMLVWWIIEEQFWMHFYLRKIFEIIGVSGFLFASGISTVLSLRNSLEKVEKNPRYTQGDLLRESYQRATLYLVFALLYNGLTVSLVTFINEGIVIGLWSLWSWYILLTIAICLFFAYPLIKINKTTRVIIAVFCIFITYPIFESLNNLRENNFGYAVLFHLLFSASHEDPILPFFGFYCLGTVLGDIYYEVYSIEDEALKKEQVKNTIIKNFLIAGILLVITSIILSLFVFDDLSAGFDKGSFAWMWYAIGCDILILAGLTYLHEFKLSPEWRHPFLFYFSYYSLTIYIVHNIVAPLFWAKLDIFWIWPANITTTIIIWYIFKKIYNKYGSKASLKSAISKMVKDKSNLK